MEELKDRRTCISELVALFGHLDEGRYVLEDVMEQVKIKLNNTGDHFTIEAGGLWTSFNKVEEFLDALAFIDVGKNGRWCVAVLEHPETWRLWSLYDDRIVWSGYASEMVE